MPVVELLSPAKNPECGFAAVNHGADAVYIGAPQFGARAVAGNTVQDIEQLTRYAHGYRSRIFVAMNTILLDSQLEEARKIAWQLYNAGVDALIIQDMGLLKVDLPPLPLHASTQTDNRTPEKVRFLQDVGFSRAVLARELSLKQMEEISSQTDIELEAFVHGALCVSYSGQCYMSYAGCGRSANRGECAQYCRLPYDLEDAEGKTILRNKHLLSLKDLDLSGWLEEMMNAGVMSFKIEGRMKNVDYVKNITAFYRKKMDAILEKDKRFRKTSLGKTSFFFDPDPEKSFRRSSTQYFSGGRVRNLIQSETPKSTGELLGKVKSVQPNFFEIETAKSINNGDGLCFINKEGELSGCRVNRVEDGRIFPASMPVIEKGLEMYRNQDFAFEKQLQSKTSERKIAVDILFRETEPGFFIQATDEEGIVAAQQLDTVKELANNAATVEQNIRRQFSKLGNTIYEAGNIHIELSQAWFLPMSKLTEWRRALIADLDKKRDEAYQRELPRGRKPGVYPEQNLTYTGNVVNTSSLLFYKENGVKDVQPGFEIKADKNVPLMFCKYCIKYEMGWCPKEGATAQLVEPLYLKHNNKRFKLHFDCKRCEMQISMA